MFLVACGFNNNIGGVFEFGNNSLKLTGNAYVYDGSFKDYFSDKLAGSWVRPSFLFNSLLYGVSCIDNYCKDCRLKIERIDNGFVNGGVIPSVEYNCSCRDFGHSSKSITDRLSCDCDRESSDIVRSYLDVEIDRYKNYLFSLGYSDVTIEPVYSFREVGHCEVNFDAHVCCDDDLLKCETIFCDFFDKVYTSDDIGCCGLDVFLDDCKVDFDSVRPLNSLYQGYTIRSFNSYIEFTGVLNATFRSYYQSTVVDPDLNSYLFVGNNRCYELPDRVRDLSYFSLNLACVRFDASSDSFYPDSDYLIVLNMFDKEFYSDRLFCDNKIDDIFHYKFYRRQVIGALKFLNNELYLVEKDYINDPNWAYYSVIIPPIESLSDENDGIYSISDFYFKGDIVHSLGDNSIVNPNKFFTVELINLGDIMACSDECMLDLISAIEGLATIIDDNGGEINTNLASIDDALRNFGQFISFPKSYDINVKEVPCIDFCSGATINTSTTVNAGSTITLSPLSSLIVSSMPADYLSLISSIISALGNLLKPSDTLQVQVAAGSTIVQNNVPVPSVTVSPAAVTVNNNVPTPSVTVNTPDTVSIDSIPCLDFCNGANLGINSVPSDLFDDLIEQLEAQENTLTAFANLFKTACNTGIGEAFSEAFNLTNCIGSVFKANDDIWNGEDTLAGIWYKQLDYNFVQSNNIDTAFYFKDLVNNSYFYRSIPFLIRASFTHNNFSTIKSLFEFTKSFSITDVLKFAFFVNAESGSPARSHSVFGINLGGGNDNFKILNHACNVNPCNIAFCEDIPLEMPTPEVSVTNNVPVPSVTNNVPVPSVTNNVPVPSVDVDVAAPNVTVNNNIPEAPVLPDNIFINADGKTFLNNNNFK